MQFQKKKTEQYSNDIELGVNTIFKLMTLKHVMCKKYIN